MGLTVRQALQVGALKESKILGGHQGLDNVIKFVNIMEVPEVIKWMRGGELLVTAGFALKDDSETHRRLIRDLANKGVAAFGIKPGQYYEEVPKDFIEFADEVGLPLIELPRETPYMDFMLPIFEQLINDKVLRLKKTEEIHNRLIEVVLTRNGLPSLSQTLAHLADNPVLIVDGRGDLITSAWPADIGDCTMEEYEAELLASLELEKARLFSLNPHRWHRVTIKLRQKEYPIVIVRIDINGQLNGFLVILESQRTLDMQDIMAMEHSATIIALEFLKEKIVIETERQIRDELLEDLIEGHYRYEEDVIRRASYLKFDLTARVAVFVINVESFASESGEKENKIQRLKMEFNHLIHNAFRDYPGGVMLLSKSNSITGLIKISPRYEIDFFRKRLIEILLKVHKQWPRLKVSAGVGRTVEAIRLIRRSYEEAMDALRIAGLMYDEKMITFFEDLGPFCFLFELQESMAMFNFFQETLGKVIAYDSQNNGELIKTLIHYFKYDCNLRLTAENLFIHKNTVLYRIRKVEEISELSLNDPEHKFNMQLALKIKQVIDKTIGTGNY